VKVSAYATEIHYAHHLLPVWNALDESERGSFHVGRRALPALQKAGIRPARPQVTRSPDPIMVAGYADIRRTRGRPVILLEHGAGQAYGHHLADGSYSGGRGREAVVLFLCPSEVVARRNRDVYPNAKALVVGCPRMDHWHRINPTGGRLTRQGGPSEPTVAISFHWDCTIWPESRWAYPHFAPALPELARTFNLIGHGHPRAWHFLKRRYAEMGIEAVADFESVLQRADVYVIDNSSTGIEFASTGRPIVWMNAPWYRRDVIHHGRFWDWVAGGVQVDEPQDLVTAVKTALADAPPMPELRRKMVASAYDSCDGRASERAAEAVRALLSA
jgi:glycosyltransferase involved in cell wall biosynthesis